jgi:selenocysteine lyase/cysteine desulfurase
MRRISYDYKKINPTGLVHNGMTPSTTVSIEPSWPQLVAPEAFGGAFAEELRGQVNLDYAATTPALKSAVDAVLRALPAYGSVHRGGGARSRITTDAYEAARASIERFVDCGDDHVVVFVRNTTEAINLVAASLPRSSRILCSPLEHHANLLPWRDHSVQYLPFTNSPAELVERAAEALDEAAASGRPFDVLATCGASNVTGEVMPAEELARVAHQAGTQLLLDAAQLAPHRRVSVRSLGVDYLALSGHKLYAPFGTGVLVVRRDLLQAAPPLLKGGGAVRVVTLRDVAWAELPHRLEAGTPNVLGAIALAAACDELAAADFGMLEARETGLAERLWEGLGQISGCTQLRAWEDADRIGVATFTLSDVRLDSREIAETLGTTYGVAVRSGLFCAHPFVAHLLGTSESDSANYVRRARAGEEIALPGAVRASIGIGVEHEHVDRLLSGLQAIAALGPSTRL